MKAVPERSWRKNPALLPMCDRWNWMEDAIFFDYFTIERIFAFLLKLEMIERWISLDKERGNQLFRSIIESLKNEVQIPAEFR